MKHLVLLVFTVVILISCIDKRPPSASFIGNKDGMTLFRKEFALKPYQDSLIGQFTQLTSLDSTAEAYWKVIKIGEPYIEELMNNLQDTTPTRVYDKCLKDYLNVGDVCFHALEEIVDLPTFAVFGYQTCIIEECWPFYGYSHNPEHKEKIEHDIRYFLENNEFRREPLDKSQRAEFKKKMGITTKLGLWSDPWKSDPAPF